MCGRTISDDSFQLIYIPDQYKTQQMCDKAVDDFLPTLNFVPDWFVTSRMIKKLLLLSMQIKVYYTLMKILVMLYLIIMKWVFLIQILIILNLTIIILMKMSLVLLFMSEFWRAILNLKKRKALKKELNEELMPVAWHPNRQWDWCMPEDQKKEIDPMFIEEL